MIGKIIRSLRLGCLALLGVALLSTSAARAEELVKFAPVPSGAAGPSIQGYLSKPKGKGPFPAVVVLHSCLGPRADRGAMARMLTGWGYVALFVDDFATRGLKDTCAVDFPEGLADAFGGLAFVSTLPDVDTARIAALGYSQGADTALKVAVAGGAAATSGPRFKAAAAFYPPCQNEAGARLRLPTMILIGAADSVTPAAQCAALVHQQSGGDVRMMVYRGAGHVFDDPQFTGGKRLLGMWLEFDADAAAQSRKALHDFLATELGR